MQLSIYVTEKDFESLIKDIGRPVNCNTVSKYISHIIKTHAESARNRTTIEGRNDNTVKPMTKEQAASFKGSLTNNEGIPKSPLYKRD